MLVVQRSHQRIASEEPGHATLRGGFDAASLVRGYEHAHEDHSLQAQTHAFRVVSAAHGPSQREAQGAFDHDSRARAGRHPAGEGLHPAGNAVDREGIAAQSAGARTRGDESEGEGKQRVGVAVAEGKRERSAAGVQGEEGK